MITRKGGSEGTPIGGEIGKEVLSKIGVTTDDNQSAITDEMLLQMQEDYKSYKTKSSERIDALLKELDDLKNCNLKDTVEEKTVVTKTYYQPAPQSSGWDFTDVMIGVAAVAVVGTVVYTALDYLAGDEISLLAGDGLSAVSDGIVAANEVIIDGVVASSDAFETIV